MNTEMSATGLRKTAAQIAAINAAREIWIRTGGTIVFVKTARMFGATAEEIVRLMVRP